MILQMVHSPEVNGETVAEALMGHIRIATVPLGAASYKFISGVLAKDEIMEDAPNGAIIYRKLIILNVDLRLDINVYNGSYRMNKPHMDLDVWREDDDIDGGALPLTWKTVTDEIPEKIVFENKLIGIDEDYHILFSDKEP